MGLDITVVMADWEHLARIPAAERLQALDDAVYPPYCCVACDEADLVEGDGWAWPRRASWCAEYRFFGTTGSYSWHFHLANTWDDMRPLAAPDLRDDLDCFLGGLVWDGPDYDTGTDPDDGCLTAGGFPDDPRRGVPGCSCCAPRRRCRRSSAPGNGPHRGWRNSASPSPPSPPGGRRGPAPSTRPSRSCTSGPRWSGRPGRGAGV
ncbi:hypothetical protein WKI68_10185 [Streptomyces sp. MS1.HAVA.3]|uniref:Uncharacterized protein n=1 Tax=Streptomyces caledonius TaxID=3134107 RepID=A0ABU8U218_9ACTN